MKLYVPCLVFLFFLAPFAFAGLEVKPKGAPSIEFVQPKNGEVVKSPFKVKMLVKGIKVRPAGENADETTSGHHHLLINKDPIPKGIPIPTDEDHIHYGKAQTEAEVKLKPGKHRLTLQFADGAHRSYGPELATSIEVTVAPSSKN